MAKKKEVVGMGSFSIKGRSEDGIKVPLLLPDGEETEHFLMVRGADSAAFRKAQARAHRGALELLKLSKAKKPIDAGDLAMRQAKVQRDLLSNLIAGWSFEAECTPETVSDFFEEAPQIEEMVNEIAGDRSQFFKKA
jgi:hypothetical protein|tara:strand:+ start:667 stop:1077 length:411 start_codon:yes stop_codon:yes gene_type:complete